MKSKTTVSQKPLSEVITVEFDNNSDGKIDLKFTDSRTFDKQGNLIRSVSERIAGDKIEQRSINSN
jgi:hypothetical protein